MLDSLSQESVQSWIGVGLDLASIGTLWQVLNQWSIVAISKAKLSCLTWWRLWNELLLNGVVVIVQDLNVDFKFINLSLHQLLGTLSQEGQIELDGSTFHDLLSELDGAVLPVLDNLPELIGQSISSLVKLLLSLLILSEVWVVVGELVEL